MVTLGFSMSEKLCENCNKPTTNAKFCSRSCSISYNNRLRVVSEETKAKISKSTSGKNNHFYGKHHTEESKMKNRLSNLGKPRNEEYRELKRIQQLGSSNSFYGKHHSKESIEKISNSNKERWNSNEYSYSNLQGYRKLAIEHYGTICEYCKTTEGRLEVHHLDGDRSNNNISNLSVLCRQCHHDKAHIRVRSSDGRYLGMSLNKEFSKIILESRK